MGVQLINSAGGAGAAGGAAPPIRGVAASEAGPSPLARRALVNWCRRHAKGGDAHTVGGRRTIRPGEPAPLTRSQQCDLADSLRDTLPGDYGLDGHLWSRRALGELINYRYGVVLSPTGVNRQLRAWGLGPRTPTERACPLCVGPVVSWLSGVYPGVARHARSVGAQVCWLGRSRLIGLCPGVDVLTAVTARGGLRFSVVTGQADAPLPTGFLARLTAHEGRGVHAILDGSFTAADWPRRTPPGVVLHPMPCCARGWTA